jgi:arginine deiminase
MKTMTTMKKLFSMLALLMMTAVGATAQAQETVMTYPQAEWLKAGDILMHTPGQELFCGVIHPSAGLFEHYFDVDKAADEHRNYIMMLQKNGIRVHTVTGILNEVGIDSLRSLAANVLHYDITGIPGESAEATETYRQDVLAKMSRSDLMRCILLQPTVKLLKTDNNTGYEAKYIQSPLMNLYFTRDQSITTPRGHVICNMNSSQRTPETDIIELCYNHLGLKPILRIEGDGRLEGGDYIPAGTISLIGCGMRTNDEGIRQMMESDAFGHDTIVVVRDHKLWQMQMHLDTHFNIIDRDLCTMVRSRLEAQPGQPEYGTCDIWARKPGTKEYSLWRRDLSFVDYIKSRGFEIIPIDEADELHYANNFLTIAPRHIMAVGGQSEELQQRFHDAGVTVEWIPLESLIDGYGAAHCMTQVLQREASAPTTDINKVSLSLATQRGKKGATIYRIDGIPATARSGIVITGGEKFVKK